MGKTYTRITIHGHVVGHPRAPGVDFHGHQIFEHSWTYDGCTMHVRGFATKEELIIGEFTLDGEQPILCGFKSQSTFHEAMKDFERRLRIASHEARLEARALVSAIFHGWN